MTIKERFKYIKERDEWRFNPYVISNKIFNSIDWFFFEKNFEEFLKKQPEINEKSVEALLKYAKSINFFTEEEFDDLEFLQLEIDLLITKSFISDFIVYYCVTENEKSRIPWKDVYGVWEVHYQDFEIIKTIRA